MKFKQSFLILTAAFSLLTTPFLRADEEADRAAAELACCDNSLGEASDCCDCCLQLPDEILATVSWGSCAAAVSSTVTVSRQTEDDCVWVGLVSHPPEGESNCSDYCKGLFVKLVVDCDSGDAYVVVDNHCCVSAEGTVAITNLLSQHALSIIDTANCGSVDCEDCTGPITVTLSHAINLTKN